VAPTENGRPSKKQTARIARRAGRSGKRLPGQTLNPFPTAGIAAVEKNLTTTYHRRPNLSHSSVHVPLHRLNRAAVNRWRLPSPIRSRMFRRRRGLDGRRARILVRGRPKLARPLIPLRGLFILSFLSFPGEAGAVAGASPTARLYAADAASNCSMTFQKTRRTAQFALTSVRRHRVPQLQTVECQWGIAR